MKSILLDEKLLGLVEMNSGLVNASLSLPEWQAVKMTFFAPCAGNKTLLRSLTCAKNRHSTIHFHYACNELVDTTIYQRVKISLPPKVGTGALTFWGANYQRSGVSVFLIKAGCQKRDAFYQFCWGYNLNNRDACAACKKVVSDSPGLVHFVIGLVNSVFNLPDGQVMFFEEFE